MCLNPPIIFDRRFPTGVFHGALEWVEGYLCVSSPYRTIIYPPDTLHRNTTAVCCRHNCNFSWTTLKVISYCTLILPLVALLARAILRYSLKIPATTSCYVEVYSDNHCRCDTLFHTIFYRHTNPCPPIDLKKSIIRPSEAIAQSDPSLKMSPQGSQVDLIGTLPEDVIQLIIDQIDFDSKVRFGQTCHYAQQIVSKLFNKQPAIIIYENIKNLSSHSINDYWRYLSIPYQNHPFHVLLADESLDPRSWVFLMDSLMRRLDKEEPGEPISLRYFRINRFLFTLSFDLRYRFYNYLVDYQLPKYRTFFCFHLILTMLTLEQDSGQHKENEIVHLLNKYLSAQANRLITINSSTGPSINCNEWFGSDCRSSLWNASNGSIVPLHDEIPLHFKVPLHEIPLNLLETLQKRILDLFREKKAEEEFSIFISLTDATTMPVTFLRPLTEWMSREGIRYTYDAPKRDT
jgi:hypothetical protein